MSVSPARGARLAAVLAICAAMAGLSAAAGAAPITQKEALAACRAQYGKKVIKAAIGKNGKINCQWQVRREMTRQDVYEACRKKFSATTAMVHKTKTGWRCRYIGRF
ncbi:MAG: hypothetical protein ACOZAM_08600 [Pseudomonadota bacterium]